MPLTGLHAPSGQRRVCSSSDLQDFLFRSPTVSDLVLYPQKVFRQHLLHLLNLNIPFIYLDGVAQPQVLTRTEIIFLSNIYSLNIGISFLLIQVHCITNPFKVQSCLLTAGEGSWLQLFPASLELSVEAERYVLEPTFAKHSLSVVRPVSQLPGEGEGLLSFLVSLTEMQLIMVPTVSGLRLIASNQKPKRLVT